MSYKPILPNFMCLCGKSYPKQGSLKNHIKIENSFRHQIRKRGVPEGRKKNLDKTSDLQFRKIFTNYMDNDQKLTEEQIKTIFMKIDDLIESLAKQYNLQKQELIKLKKENIRLQQFYVNIQEDQIIKVMTKIFVALIVQIYGKTDIYDNNDNEINQLITFLSRSNLYQKSNKK